MSNSLKTCPATPPSYYFVILAKIDLENVSRSVSEILEVFVNTFSASDKYFLHNRKNLPEPIQLQ